MYVIGTAGHVDHGKSALVKALTGIDPDRLQEEQARGMTIDLGFAWLRLPSGQEVSIVDVPGHERFIKNMLAGVGGIDLALLVIAADEGVMPQTREHLAILDLLQVRRGLLVLTKADLVDAEWLELVAEEVREVVRGTTLEGAPLLVTSAVTGQGLPELIAAIEHALQAIPPKRDLGRPRLPIDRAFTVAGFGTVVTGTLIDGRLSLGDEVEIVPGPLRSRIRGLQIHRQRVETALPGNRVAANLAGLAKEDLWRGQLLTHPGWLQPSTVLDVRLRVLADWPRPLRHNSTVLFHALTSEVQARLRLLDQDAIEPGEEGWAQLRLEAPAPVVQGDRFILRAPSGTIGGGSIVELQPPRHRRFHAPTLQRLHKLLEGDPRDLLLATIAQHEPLELRELAQRAHLPPAHLQQALEQLISERQLVVLGALPDPTAVLFTAERWQRTSERAREAVAAYHKLHPLREGMPKEELRARLRLTQRAFAAALERWQAERALADTGKAVRLFEHLPQLTPQQEAEAEAYLRRLEASPFAPPTDQHPSPELIAYLSAQGRIVPVSEDVIFAASAYRTMVERIVATLEAQGSITVAQVRDMFGTSRKYALALLEHLDEVKVTRRIGDERRLYRA